MRALIFPGQGSQTVGMGKDFFDAYGPAKQVFQEVDDTLSPLYGKALSSVIFDGPDDVLTQTLYTQAALMTTSIAMLKVIEAEKGSSASDFASYAAGHSLGEYTALCAAGVLSLSDTAKLLYHRGKAMTECTPKDGGAMAAIMGLDFDDVWELTEDSGSYVANDNGGGQIVISGTKEAIEKAIQIATDKGAKRAIPLAVSAPFHCPLMKEAATVMAKEIAQVIFSEPKIPVITNVTGEAVSDSETLKQGLIDQICGQVRWRESVLFMERVGISKTLEIGPGKVLTNLVKRISPNIQTANIAKVEDISTAFGE